MEVQICPLCFKEAPGGLYSHGPCNLCETELGILHCGCYHEQEQPLRVPRYNKRPVSQRMAGLEAKPSTAASVHGDAMNEDQKIRMKAWRDLGNLVDKLDNDPVCREYAKEVDRIRASLFIPVEPMTAEDTAEALLKIQLWWDAL